MKRSEMTRKRESDGSSRGIGPRRRSTEGEREREREGLCVEGEKTRRKE